jgi:hypothetical protein
VLPLFERNLLVMTDESTGDNAVDWPKLIWILDRPQRGQSDPDLHLPAAEPGRL